MNAALEPIPRRRVAWKREARRFAAASPFVLPSIVLFAFVHVFQVIVTGLWNNVRSMISGRYRVDTTIPGESHESR